MSTLSLLAATVATAAATTLLGAAPVQDDGAVQAPVSAGAVIERAVEAMGGRAAFEGLESYSMKVTKFHLSGTNRRESPFDFAFIAPNQVKAVQHSAIGPVIMAFDGQRGWTKPGMMKTQPTTYESMAPVADIARLPRIAFDLEREFEIHPSVTIVTFDERPCYRLSLKRRTPRAQDGRPPHVLLADVETGRPTAFQRSGVMRGVDFVETMRFTQWTTFGDLNLFTAVHSDGTGQPEYHIERFEANQVEPSEFAVPPDLEEPGGG